MNWRSLALAIGLLGISPAGAQPQVVARLSIGSPDQSERSVDGLLAEGLRKLGHKVGQSLVIETRWAHGDISRYPHLARELIEKHRPALIVTSCGPALKAIREINRTLPVFAHCADEKNFLGEIASLSRPGGYTTGATFLSPESVGKRLELLREIIPALSRLAVLHATDDPIDAHWRELERLQSKLGLEYQRFPVARAEEIDGAFETMVRGRAQAVFLFPTNRIIGERVRIADLARKHRVASVAEFSFHVDAGSLLSYGASVNELVGRTAPMYVDKILKGAKPAELPILQPTKFELVINLKTAREIGVKIPQSVLLRADRLIE